MEILTLNESDIRKSVTLEEAIDAVEKAFVALSQKEAVVPSVMHLDFPSHGGEVHVKAAHLLKLNNYTLKVASGFYSNRARNLPTSSGMMIVFSAETGYPLAILVDNCYLTDLRTAAAGAVAAKHMASNRVEQVGILGAGVQGRLQLQALACVRKFKRVKIYDHHQSNIERYIALMAPQQEAEIEPAATVEEAVRHSGIVITSTPSRSPLVQAEWVQPGTHITAMGSDGADKQELDVKVLEKADRIIADSIVQCVKYGEIHHAVERGVLKLEDVDGEIGDVITGKISGRANDAEITICDLTGVGVQDAAIADLVYRKTSGA